MALSNLSFSWSEQTGWTQFFRRSMRAVGMFSIYAYLGVATQALACSPENSVTVEQAFSAAKLVVSGEIVDRRIVEERFLLASLGSTPRTAGARFVRPPGSAATNTAEDLDVLYSLFVDLEVDEVLSGAVGTRVTFVIGPYQSEERLKQADFTADISKAIFMLGDRRAMRTFAPYNIPHRSMVKNELRVAVLGQNCMNFYEEPAILDYQQSTIDYLRKLLHREQG